MTDSIEAKLDRLEASAPIALDSVDFDVLNPEKLREQLGSVFNYFARVESEVIMNVGQVKALLPHLDDWATRFLGIWESQELPHGAIFDEIQRHLNLKPAPVETNRVGFGIKLAGYLGKRIPDIHQIFLVDWLKTGGIQERLTSVGYHFLKSKLINIGERPFVETAINRIIPQEGGHSGFYLAADSIESKKLSSWQRKIGRWVLTNIYAPVGAYDKHKKAAFGEVALNLAGENVDNFAKPIQALASELLREDTGPPPPLFVVKAIKECIEEAREQRVAA